MLSSLGCGGEAGGVWGGDTMENRVTAVGNSAEWELLDISERKRGRKRQCGGMCEKEREKGNREREKLELFLVIGNDGRAVWGPHGSDPVTALSRENRVPGHVSSRPLHRHTPALLHVHTHTHTHTLSATIHISSSKERERASPQKKQGNYHTFPLLHVDLCQLCSL